MVTPEPGDFAAVRTGGDIGLLIRIGQWLNGTGFKDFEHALVCVGPALAVGSLIPGTEFSAHGQAGRKVQKGEVWVKVLEAEPGGSRVRYRMCLDTDLWSTGIIDITPEQRAKVADLAPQFTGIEYSALVYFALALHHFHVNTKDLQNYIDTHKQDICSQLVDAFELALGVHLFQDGRWPGDVTPEDLANLLQEEQLKKAAHQ